jgi:DNA-directed RNA polymerase I, II, and III subunit RPABC3
MGDAQLFSDTFTITNIDSKKYDRVARLSANTENRDTVLTLDVNSEVYPCSIGERLHVLLASTLSLDGSKDDGKGWREVGRGEQSLADEYDYVCHGKIYRFEEGDEENMSVISERLLRHES